MAVPGQLTWALIGACVVVQHTFSAYFVVSLQVNYFLLLEPIPIEGDHGPINALDVIRSSPLFTSLCHL
jgi:hypothetical protein